MADDRKPIYEGAKPQVENIRGVTPQHEGGIPNIQGGVQPQHTGETGQIGGDKPPASK